MITPKPELALQMNHDVNGRLEEAFRYITSDVLGYSEDFSLFSDKPQAHALQGLIRNAAVQNNIDEIRALYKLHGHILFKPDIGPSCKVVPFDIKALGHSEAEVLQAAYVDDIGLTSNLIPPNANQTIDFNNNIEEIKGILSSRLPLWWSEFENLTKLILLARSEGQVFGGASAFSAWGSILINPDLCTSPLNLSLNLIHESSHLKLFYAYLDDEIVLNSPTEVYSSPLRRKPRPMNGIYHAAFVLARMVLFINDLRALGHMDNPLGLSLKDCGTKALLKSIASFDAAYAVICTDGKLTQKGTCIIEDAAHVVAACKRTLETA